MKKIVEEKAFVSKCRNDGMTKLQIKFLIKDETSEFNVDYCVTSQDCIIMLLRNSKNFLINKVLKSLLPFVIYHDL